MNMFGVREEVVQACLSFRTKMVDFMTYKLTVEENREEICSVINNIYSVFGCRKRNISVSDFFITSDDGKWAEFLFPVYRNLRYNSIVKVKRRRKRYLERCRMCGRLLKAVKI